MLLALWSPKGGAGTSVLAAACALVLARRADGARLADLGGDQPAIFGLGAEPATGLADWLAAGPEAPADALDRLASMPRPASRCCPRGAIRPPARAAARGRGRCRARRRAARRPVAHDRGCRHAPTAPAARAVVEVADVSVVVLRGCYLALAARRAQPAARARRRHRRSSTSRGVRSARAEVADVLDRPVLARVPVRASIARAVDAGVLAARLPDVLARVRPPGS